jgi:hypothetical protein
MLSASFETEIPAIKWLQTYALDHTTTGIGLLFTMLLPIEQVVVFKRKELFRTFLLVVYIY